MSGCVGVGASALLFRGGGGGVICCQDCPASIVIIQKAVERVYTSKVLRYRCCLDISADKQYNLLCEEGSF